MLPNPEQPADNEVIANPEQKSVVDRVWWLALVLLMVGFAGTWMNHFGNGFHRDDIHAIVDNPAIRSPSLGRITSSARAASALPEYAAWRPLTGLTWALDYRISGPESVAFHLDSFLWLLWVLVGVYTLSRLTPDSNRYSALFAASLVAFHPLTADTLNYLSHRYVILRALGLLAALVLFDALPRRLPAVIWYQLPRIPRNKWDVLMRRFRTNVLEGWKLLISTPAPWYFVPLVVGLFADPGTAIFPLLLVVWIRLFSPERNVREVIPSGILCGVWWLAHTLITWAPTAPQRQPAFLWWWSQPWVALRYLGAWFAPVHLSADSGLLPLIMPFTAQAITGVVGVGLLILIAVRTARSDRFKTVSFGLSWFLITLLPDFLIPQANVEDLSRAFVPMLGLSIAAGALLWMIVLRFRVGAGWDWPGVRAVAAVATIAIAILAFQAHQRNQIWLSEASLWGDVLERSPSNPHALLNVGRAQIISGSADIGYKDLERARSLQPQNPDVELNLAVYAEPSGRKNSEDHFRRALALAPSSPLILAAYSDWLLLKQRNKEALELGNRAVALDPWGAPGRRAVMNVELSNRQWADAAAFAHRTLELLPGDPDAIRGVNVASNALDEIARSESRVKTNPTADNYLQLSIIHMQNGRFQEGIEACKAALKIQPNAAEAWSNISVGYHMLGKTDESIAALREAIRLRPDLPNLRQNLEAEFAAKSAQQAGGSATPSRN